MFLKELVFSYDADFASSLLVVDVPATYAITAFQINMIANNTCPNVLKVKQSSEDDHRLLYDVTSMITLKVYMKRKCFSEREFLSIVKCYLQTLTEGKNYYLNERNFVIDLDHIYIDPATGKLGMVYVPIPEMLEQDKGMVDFIYCDLIINGSYMLEGHFDYMKQLLNLKSDMVDALNTKLMLKTVCDLLYSNASLETDAVEHNEISNSNKQIATTPLITDSEEQKAVNGRDKINALIYGSAVIAMLLLAMFMKKTGIGLQKIVGCLVIVAAISVYCRKWVMEKQVSEKSVEKLRPHDLMTNRKKKGKDLDRRDSVMAIDDEDLKNIKFLDVPIEKVSNETILLKQGGVKKFISTAGDLSIDLKQGSSLLGRQKDLVDYWIEDDSSVGRVHAEIICEKEAIYIRDMNSKNGTYVNGERVRNNMPTAVESGDKVSFGGLQFQYKHHGY